MQQLSRQQWALFVSSSMYQFVCFTLLVVNSFYLTANYFNYSIIFYVAPYTPLLMKIPKFSLCMPLTTVFSEQPNKTFYDEHEDRITGMSFNDFQKLLPDADNIAVSCSYRDWSLDRMIYIPNSVGCSEHFRIKVYRLQGYFCWVFDPPDQEYSFYAVINTMNDRRVLYNVAINDDIAFGWKYRPVAHQEQFPIDDLRFGDELLASVHYNESFPVTYAEYEIQTLPPPYATMCRNETVHHCYSRCLTLVLAKKGISPIANSPEVDDPSLPIVRNVTHIDEEQMKQVMRTAEGLCRSSCSNFRPCSHLTLRTQIASPYHGPIALEFSVETISEPVIRTVTGPKLTLLDLLYQIATLAGTWIGFSIYHAFLLAEKLATRESMRKQFNALRMKYKSTLRIKKKLAFILEFRFGMRYRVRRFLHLSQEKRPMNKQQVTTNRIVKFLSLTVKAVAGIALAVQIINICQSYFEYSIRTELDYGPNPKVGTPVIALCVPYIWMMNPPKMSPFDQQNYDENFRLIQERFGNLTMVDILDQTWQPEEIMKACRWRNSNNSQMSRHTRDECYSAFNITRFFLDRQVCFKFNAFKRVEATQLIQKLYPSDPGLFFSIVFSDKMARLPELLVIIFDPSEDVPLESRDFAGTIFPTHIRKFFIASMAVFNRYSLPAPYVTRCRNEVTWAIRRCVYRKTWTKFSRVPQSEVFTDRGIKKYFPGKLLISYADINSTEAIAEHKRIEDECDREFFTQECNSHIVKTITLPPYRSFGELEVAVDSHAYFELNTYDRPAFMLYDFYFLIVSTVTFWTAITMLSFNPSAFILQHSKFQLRHTSTNALKKIENNINAMKGYLNFVLTLDNFFLYRQPKQDEQLQSNRICSIPVARLIRGKYLLHILCTLGCVVHLYSTVSDYLQYLTVLNTQNRRETNESFPDLTICLSTYDLLSKNDSFNRNHVKKDDKDPFPAIQFTEIFYYTPPVEDLVVACSYRGLQFGEIPLPLLTKRIYFQENNATLCNSLFNMSKFLLQGYVCYRYRKKHVTPETRMEALHHINAPRNIFSLVIDSNILTDEFALVVGDRAFPELFGSLWAPSIDKKGPNIYMSISYIKYIRHVQPPPYTTYGFTDESLFICIHFCLLDRLKPMGLADPGFYMAPMDVHYITASEREEIELRTLMQSLEINCAKECRNKNGFTAASMSSYVPLVNEWRANNRTNTTEFQITQTEFPVITVIFSPLTSFFQLSISIGSILGIWYGFCAVHFDPSQLFQKTTSEMTSAKLMYAEQQLTFLSNTFYKLNLYFITRKSGGKQ